MIILLHKCHFHCGSVLERHNLAPSQIKPRLCFSSGSYHWALGTRVLRRQSRSNARQSECSDLLYERVHLHQRGIHDSLQTLFWRYNNFLQQMYLTVQMRAADWSVFTLSVLRDLCRLLPQHLHLLLLPALVSEVWLLWLSQGISSVFFEWSTFCPDPG